MGCHVFSCRSLLWIVSAITSQNKNGGDSWGTLYYKKSKNLSGEAYIQSSNTNLPGIIKPAKKSKG